MKYDRRQLCEVTVAEMDYISIKQVSERWGLPDSRIRTLCEQGKIDGAFKRDNSYLIPADAVKPADDQAMKGVVIPQEYADLFWRVDALKDEIDRRRPLTQGELQRLKEEFLITFTYNSNAIEGNTLTLRETALVLEGVTIDKKPLKDHLETVGHRDAFLYVQELVSDKTAISEKVIKDIHSLILIDKPTDKGVYRRIPVTIMGAFHEPPQPYLVPLQMEQLMADHKKAKRHIIEQTALFHLEFEGIHPFIDGNGRTGRLILNLMLMQQGYPPINIKFADRQRYYSCFDRYYRDKTGAPMVEMIAQYLLERLEQYLAIL